VKPAAKPKQTANPPGTLPAPAATARSSGHRGARTFTVTVQGRYATDTWVHGSSCSAVAYAVVPKVPGGLWYTVTGTGFNDAAYYGRQLTLTFSAAGAIARPADGHGDTRVQDRGDTLWACLSSISGPMADIGDAVPSFDVRFAGMTIKAVVSVRMPPE
jgi:hypothetical protein